MKSKVKESVRRLSCQRSILFPSNGLPVYAGSRKNDIVAFIVEEVSFSNTGPKTRKLKYLSHSKGIFLTFVPPLARYLRASISVYSCDFPHQLYLIFSPLCYCSDLIPRSQVYSEGNQYRILIQWGTGKSLSASRRLVCSSWMRFICLAER